MEWRSVSHPTLGIPVLPNHEQLVLAYCGSLAKFAIGYWRGGSWQLQPPPGGAITHWVPLIPPKAAEHAPSGPPAAGSKVPTARYTVPAPPAPPKKR